MFGGYVKAVLVCISITSASPFSNEAINLDNKCLPISVNKTTNVLDEALLTNLNQVQERFFVSNIEDTNLVHGDLIIDASSREYSVDAAKEVN